MYLSPCRNHHVVINLCQQWLYDMKDASLLFVTSLCSGSVVESVSCQVCVCVCEFVASPHDSGHRSPHQPFHPDNKEPPAARTGGLLNEISYQSPNSCGLCVTVRSGCESPSAALSSYHLDVYHQGGKLAGFLSRVVCVCGLWLPRERHQPLKQNRKNQRNNSFPIDWCLSGSYPTLSSQMEFGVNLLLGRRCGWRVVPVVLIKSYRIDQITDFHAAVSKCFSNTSHRKKKAFICSSVGVLVTFDPSGERKTE